MLVVDTRHGRGPFPPPKHCKIALQFEGSPIELGVEFVSLIKELRAEQIEYCGRVSRIIDAGLDKSTYTLKRVVESKLFYNWNIHSSK